MHMDEVALHTSPFILMRMPTLWSVYLVLYHYFNLGIIHTLLHGHLLTHSTWNDLIYMPHVWIKRIACISTQWLSCLHYFMSMLHMDTSYRRVHLGT
jgi:hypothetical protein